MILATVFAASLLLPTLAEYQASRRTTRTFPVLTLSLQDHYKILKLSNDCSQRDVKKAYIKLSLVWHPDKHADPQKKAVANQEMVRVNAAYEVLSNTERRAEYDQEQKHGYSFESFSDFDFRCVCVCHRSSGGARVRSRCTIFLTSIIHGSDALTECAPRP